VNKKLITLSVIILVIAIILFAYQEETQASHYFIFAYESIFGVGSWSTEICKDYCHPYMTWGFITQLVALVILIFGTRGDRK